MCVFLLLALLVGSVAPVSAQEKDAAQEQYYVASAAYNRKLYPVAVTQFGEFLQKNPKHAKADSPRTCCKMRSCARFSTSIAIIRRLLFA